MEVDCVGRVEVDCSVVGALLVVLVAIESQNSTGTSMTAWSNLGSSMLPSFTQRSSSGSYWMISSYLQFMSLSQDGAPKIVVFPRKL